MRPVRFPAVLTAVAAAACLLPLARGADAPAAKPAAKPPEPLKITQRTVASGGVVVAKLSNGLTVIVKATRSAPVVCVRAYVRAGSMYEVRYLGCGISHLVEHLVAKGAVHEGQSPRQQDTRSRVSDIGGQSNASTSMGRTQYYISAAAGRAMECIDLIADWMARPRKTSAASTASSSASWSWARTTRAGRCGTPTAPTRSGAIPRPCRSSATRRRCGS